MSTDEILLGLGLVVVLAVGAQLLSRRLGLPAIVLLLPAGFVAGIATDDVHPEALLGPLFQPFVSIAVGVILFEAGLRLSFAEVASELRRAVGRLILVGIAVSWVGITATVALLYPAMNLGVATLIGAILVVSGPTVVLPLLGFIRPAPQVRSLLKWEGVLVDPVGAILGVLVFLGVQSASDGGTRWHPGELLVSVGVGVLVGVAGALALWSVLREVVRNAPRAGGPRDADGGGRRGRGRRPDPRGRRTGGGDGHGDGAGQSGAPRAVVADRRLADDRVPRDAGAAADRRAVRARGCVGLAE